MMFQRMGLLGRSTKRFFSRSRIIQNSTKSIQSQESDLDPSFLSTLTPLNSRNVRFYVQKCNVEYIYKLCDSDFELKKWNWSFQTMCKWINDARTEVWVRRPVHRFSRTVTTGGKWTKFQFQSFYWWTLYDAKQFTFNSE